jgi:hypothetical protein
VPVGDGVANEEADLAALEEEEEAIVGVEEGEGRGVDGEEVEGEARRGGRGTK